MFDTNTHTGYYAFTFSYIVGDTENFRSCHILYGTLSWGDHILLYLIISQYKVTLCLKKYYMSKNHMICKEKCYINRKQHAETSNTLSAGAQIPKQNKCTYCTDQYDQDAKQKSRVFYLFCLISQGILNDCVTTSIQHLHPLINQAIYSCSNRDAVFIQSSDSLRLTIFQTDE